MIISSIIKRYANTYESPLNIISSPCDNKGFNLFLSHIVPKNSNILDLDDTIFGNVIPDLILCNNKINYLDKCGHLSFFFHCPMLIIDHDIKPSFIDKDIIDSQSNSVYSLAINNQIYSSWGKTHNLVLGFDIRDNNNIKQWRNLFYQISKLTFDLKQKTYNEAKENHDKQQ